MTTVRAALVQQKWTGDKESMIKNAVSALREAASQGAQVACLQELFYGPYFCQVQDPQWYGWTEEVPGGPTVSLMQDLARELMRSLGPDGEAAATLHSRAPSDIVGGNRPRLTDGDEMIRLRHIWNGNFTDPSVAKTLLAADNANEAATGYDPGDHRQVALTAQPRGLAAREMDDGQRRQLRRLLACYLGRVPDPLSPLGDYDDERTLDGVHLAWAGPVAPGQPVYYRLQGPGLLIEYDNVQRGANHAHSVWRNPESDFGLDVLAAHRAAHH